jgi:asparagine synthase (glutamine-hydrolysing)
MSQAMIHRGPDGSGRFHAKRVAIAVRRLNIIDLATGAQPLSDENDTLVLIANGEIYNYIELRDQLRGRGHVFKSGSDCEVILHLYQEHGEDCVHHLRGMFAFALWDKRKQTLLLARDRMGEKPLYLYEQDGFLAFGSELKTLLRSGLVPFRLDPSAIDHYFHYQYVPEPMTAVQGVRKLSAASTLTVASDPWAVRERCYWRMEDAPPLDGNPAELIRAELETISEIVIRSDVPVGIALSGGLDSSAIAALAAQKYPGIMHSFSVGYTNRPHSDERSKAQAMAHLLSMPFHEIEISTGQAVESFADLVSWQDDPIADIAGFGYWALAKAAREQDVPVLLQGQGGDELFWGYPWVTAAARQSRRKSLLGPSPRPRFRDYLELTWPKTWPRRAPIDWLTSLGGFRSSLTSYQRDRIGPRERLVFYDLADHFREAAKSTPEFYAGSFRKSLNGTTPYDLFTLPLPWGQIDVEMTRLICKTYLSENGIAQGDRLSMAASVELRLPLVDYRLVETVIGLRKAHSDVGLPPKTWLKQATEDLLPDWVRKRPKRSFQPPVREWHGAIFSKYGRLLKNGALVQLGILTPQAAQRFARGEFPLTQTMSLSFNALVLEVWCRQCLGSSAALTMDSRRLSVRTSATRRAPPRRRSAIKRKPQKHTRT